MPHLIFFTSRGACYPRQQRGPSARITCLSWLRPPPPENPATLFALVKEEGSATPESPSQGRRRQSLVSEPDHEPSRVRSPCTCSRYKLVERGSRSSPALTRQVRSQVVHLTGTTLLGSGTSQGAGTEAGDRMQGTCQPNPLLP
jgi:hypothetical protein